MSDPELCESTTENNQNLPNDPSLNDNNMEKGLSVSFWLSISSDDVDVEGLPLYLIKVYSTFVGSLLCYHVETMSA